MQNKSIYDREPYTYAALRTHLNCKLRFGIINKSLFPVLITISCFKDRESWACGQKIEVYDAVHLVAIFSHCSWHDTQEVTKEVGGTLSFIQSPCLRIHQRSNQSHSIQVLRGAITIIAMYNMHILPAQSLCTKLCFYNIIFAYFINLN